MVRIVIAIALPNGSRNVFLECSPASFRLRNAQKLRASHKAGQAFSDAWPVRVSVNDAYSPQDVPVEIGPVGNRQTTLA